MKVKHSLSLEAKQLQAIEYDDIMINFLLLLNFTQSKHNLAVRTCANQMLKRVQSHNLRLILIGLIQSGTQALEKCEDLLEGFIHARNSVYKT